MLGTVILATAPNHIRTDPNDLHAPKHNTVIGRSKSQACPSPASLSFPRPGAHILVTQYSHRNCGKQKKGGITGLLGHHLTMAVTPGTMPSTIVGVLRQGRALALKCTS